MKLFFVASFRLTNIGTFNCRPIISELFITFIPSPDITTLCEFPEERLNLTLIFLVLIS